MQSITRLSPHRTALTVSVVFAVLSLIFVIPMALIMGMIPTAGPGGQGMGMGFPMGMTLLMPVFYFIMSYISTALFAMIYNLVARYTGGITFEIAREGQEVSDGLI